MDVIWKNLSENHPGCQRLSLYSQSDPGTGATFAVRCNSLMGVTSEENFLNDAMYLVEGVLPMNETLHTVEMEWSFLNHLDEDDRDSFIRGVASLKNLEEISIRGSMTEESRMRFRSLLQIPECAKSLKHFAIEVDELHVDDPAEMGLAALLFLRCQKLESFHIRGLMPTRAVEGVRAQAQDFDCSILLSALGKLPSLHTIHISRNQENPKTISATALRDVCILPKLQSLSLMNMGLNDKHCKVLKRHLFSSRQLHSLILVDNPLITEKGNKALLKLLEKNRSIYNSTFGTDSETVHRTPQLVHLHMNRCGRAKVQSPTTKPRWLEYLAKINETVPEELELDTLFLALQENPEIIVQIGRDRDELKAKFLQEKLALESTEKAIAQKDENEQNENYLSKKLPARKDMAVEDLEKILPLLSSHSLDSSIMSPVLPPVEEMDQLVQRWQKEGIIDSRPGNLATCDREPTVHESAIEEEEDSNSQHENEMRASSESEAGDDSSSDFHLSVEAHSQACHDQEEPPLPTEESSTEDNAPVTAQNTLSVSKVGPEGAPWYLSDVEGWNELASEMLQRLVDESCWMTPTISAA